MITQEAPGLWVVLGIVIALLFILPPRPRWWLVPGGLIRLDHTFWRGRVQCQLIRAATSRTLIEFTGTGEGERLRAKAWTSDDDGGFHEIQLGPYPEVVVAGLLSRQPSPTPQQVAAFVGGEIKPKKPKGEQKGPIVR